MPTLAEIENMVRPIVESRGAFVVGVAFGNDGRTKLLEIFADTDEGITTSLCAEISRALSQALNLDALFHQRYYLVVSSPGVDRPLKYPRQYPKNIGRVVKVKYQGEHGLITLEGVLVETNEHGIAVRSDKGEIERLEFAAIVETRVTTAW